MGVHRLLAVDVRIFPSEVAFRRWQAVLSEVLLLHAAMLSRSRVRSGLDRVAIRLSDPAEPDGWREWVPWTEVAKQSLGRILERLERQWVGFPPQWLGPHFQLQTGVLEREMADGSITHLTLWVLDELGDIRAPSGRAPIQWVICHRAPGGLTDCPLDPWDGSFDFSEEAIRRKLLTFFCGEADVALNLVLPSPSRGASLPLAIHGRAHPRTLNPILLPFDLGLMFHDVKPHPSAPTQPVDLEALKVVKVAGICQTLLISGRSLVWRPEPTSSPAFGSLLRALRRDDGALLARNQSGVGLCILLPSMEGEIIVQAIATQELLLDWPRVSPTDTLPNYDRQIESALNMLDTEHYYDPNRYTCGLMPKLEQERRSQRNTAARTKPKAPRNKKVKPAVVEVFPRRTSDQF